MHPQARADFGADFRRSIATSAGYVRDYLSWGAGWDIDLATISCPVALVYGEDDAMVPLPHGQWLQARLPSAQLTVVPGGHGDVTFGMAGDAFARLVTSLG